MGLGLTGVAAAKFGGSRRSILSRRRESAFPTDPSVGYTGASNNARRGSKQVNIVTPPDGSEPRRKSFSTAGPQLGFLGLTHFDGALDNMKKTMSDDRSDISDELFQTLMSK